MSKKPNLSTQVAELTQDLQKVQAEFVNFKRRTSEERAEIINLAKQDIILQLLPLLDNLQRGLTHLPESLAADPWAQGVAQIARQAEATLERLGITRVPGVGSKFNPHVHEAITMDGEGAEVITEELQAGYLLGDKLLRPAMVKVGQINKEEK
jgi:molecular chaperone GrpE